MSALNAIMSLASLAAITPSDFEEMVLEKTASFRKLLQPEHRKSLLDIVNGTSEVNKELESPTNGILGAINLIAQITYPNPENQTEKEELMIAMLLYKIDPQFQ